MNHQNRMLKFKKGVGMALSLMLLCCTLLPTANVGAANPPAPTPASAAAAVTIEQETEIPLTEAEIEAMTDVAIAETATTAGDPTMVWDLPFVRLSHTAIYDSGGDRLIIFGGYNGREFFNDVWALDVSTLSNTSWAKLNPTGPWPAPRAQHTAIYDSQNDRMVVFGGHSFHYNFDDVWALDLTTPGAEAWTQLFPSGQDPSARRWHTAVYDRDQNRMLVFGGGGNGGLFNDLWSLNLTPGAEAWTPIAVAGTVPAARVQHTAVYDDENNRMVIFGGIAAGGFRSDTWVWNAGTSQWAQLTGLGTPPAGRAGHTAVYDLGHKQMLVFGGRNADGFLNDLWRLKLEAGAEGWGALAPGDAPPEGRAWHTAVYKHTDSSLYILGGRGMSTFAGQLQWRLNIGGMVWEPLHPTLPEWWQGETTAQATALAGGKPTVILEIEDARSETVVDVMRGNTIWFVVRLRCPVSTYANNVDVILSLNPAKFQTVQAATRHNDWDAVATWTTPTSLGNGQYRFNDADMVKLSGEQDYSVQVVFRANVKNDAAEGNTGLTTDAFGDNWLAHLGDTATARVRQSTQVWILANRTGLFAEYDNNQAARLLDAVYETMPSSGKSAAVLYVDRHVPSLATWDNTTVSYSSETNANTVADAVLSWLRDRGNSINGHPSYIVVLGDDNTMPFYRKHAYHPDGVDKDHTEDDSPNCWASEPVCDALVSHNYHMTDNPYGDWQYGTPTADWEVGNLETPVGRIVGATAADMQIFFENAVLGPNAAESRAILVSDGLDWWLPGDANDAHDVLKYDMGYTMDETLTDNASASKTRIVSAMTTGFSVMAAAHHGEVDAWQAPDEADFLYSFYLPSYDPNAKIVANRPFFYFNACRIGFSYTRDWGIELPGAYDESMVYALVHRGASGIVASAGMGYGVFASNVAGSGEILANNFWLEAKSVGTQSDPLGWSLMRAKVAHPVNGNVTEKKTVQTFTYFGVPWMQLSYPDKKAQTAALDAPQSSPVWSTPQRVAGIESEIQANYSITAHVNASIYAITQTVEGFDLLEVNGLQQRVMDGELVRPQASLALILPVSATITGVVFTPTQALALPGLDLPTIIAGVPIPGGATGGYTTTVGGVYPVTVTVETSAMGTYQVARFDVIPVDYDATTDAATLYRSVDVRVLYDTPEPVALTAMALEQERYLPGETITATAHLINSGAADEVITATLVLQDAQRQVVGIKGSGPLTIPAGGSQDVTLGWQGALEGGTYWLRLLIWQNGAIVTGAGREVQLTSGELQDLTVPDSTAPGQDSTFQVTFANLGESSTVAAATLLISDGNGTPVAFLEPQMASVAANGSHTFTFTWTPTLAGDYTASAVVSAGSEEYGPLTKAFEVRGYNIFLPLVLRNSGAAK